MNPGVIQNTALATVLTPSLITQTLLDNVDLVVNPFPGLHPIPNDPQYSYVHGVAQAQHGAPTLKLSRSQSDQAEVHTPTMLRYFANTSDPKTDTLSLSCSEKS